MQDYYQTLRLTPSATFTEIRRAYRKLALELHPDVNRSRDAQQAFIYINEAYRVLKNPVTRRKYDLLCAYTANHVSLDDRQARRENRFRQDVEQKAGRGKVRSERNAKVAEEAFRKKAKRSGFWDGFGWFWNFIFEVVGAWVQLWFVKFFPKYCRFSILESQIQRPNISPFIDVKFVVYLL